MKLDLEFFTKALGFTKTTYKILNYMLDRPREQVTSVMITKDLGIVQSHVSASMKVLKERGWVTSGPQGYNLVKEPDEIRGAIQKEYEEKLERV